MYVYVYEEFNATWKKHILESNDFELDNVELETCLSL